jgi:predicted Ser/Thr protein kinase
LTPELWARVSAAFARALALSGPERERFLHELRQGNAAVADEVTSLLQQHEARAELPGVPGQLWDAAAELPRDVQPAADSPPDGIDVEDLTQSYAGPSVSAAGRAEHPFLSPPQRGDELGRLGPYRLLRVMGEGAMGIVFHAQDMQLERPVALKVVKPARLDDAGRQRFMREARAMAAVKHDHIVTIYQVGQEGEVPFLAMEFLQGQTLQHWLERGRQPSISQVLRIGRDIAAGLAAAHAAGLFHRDIKPANIWLEAPRGRVKILDFGLARSQRDDSPLTQLGAVLGTPAYMAPEQAEGKPLDYRCDLFSLGCLLYRLCIGTPAFRGKTVEETLLAVVTQEPPPPCSLNPRVPQGLSELIMRLLAKKPEDRPASAQHVVDALKALHAGYVSQPAAPEPPPPQSDGTGQRRTWTWLVAAGCAAAAAGVLCLAMLGGGWRMQPDAAEPGTPGDDDIVKIAPADAMPEAKAADAPWVALFNGKDLGGWIVHPDVAFRRGWKVENELLVAAQESGKKKKITVTRLFSQLGDFEDFHLRLEAKIKHAGNMMLYLRAPFEETPNARGVLLASGRLTGAAPVKARVPPNEWFTLEVIAQGLSIQVKINGKTTAALEETQYSTRKGHFVLGAAPGPDFTVYCRKIEVRRR